MAEIKFKRDTTFRKDLFTPESFAHPAKMDAQLLIWIVERYTKVGDTILDPMAGMGTTMLACIIGRNAVLVELEQKFVEMQNSNWERVRMMPQLGHKMGDCHIVQGDARQLHGNRLSDNEVDDGDPQRISYRQALGSIITSPPYEGIESRDRSKEVSFQREKSGRYPKRGDTNISVGYAGVSSVVTSPPYADSLSEPEDRKHSIDQTKWADGRKIAPPHSQVHLTYPSSSEGNIGNLKGDEYLSAMLQVYQQCYKVLKHGGLMIIVTKNFIRNKKEVKLDEDTIRLCEQAGFRLMERHYRKLPAQSFWRTIYQQKYPDAPVLDKEDILVFQKA